MHLDEEQIRRVLDGEVVAAQETQWRSHIAQCARCHALVEQARQDDANLETLLRSLDHAPPSISARDVMARARFRRWSWLNKAAAVFLIVMVGGVAWAAPRSPLPALLHTVVEWMAGAKPQPALPTAPPIVQSNLAGIAVPAGQRLVILFSAAQTEGQLRVELSDEVDVVVRAPAGAGAFTTNNDQLLIDNRESRATFVIEIPRAAPRVEIRVGGVRIFEVRAGRVVVPTVPGGASTFKLPLGGQ